MAKKTKIAKAFNLDITTAGDKSLPEIEEEELQRTRKTKRESKSERAGLVLPVARTWRYLKRQLIKRRIRLDAAIYLTAVLEYLIAEMLLVAGEAASDNDAKRITPRFVYLAAQLDEEILSLFKNVIIPDAGIVPHPSISFPSTPITEEEMKKKHKVDNLFSYRYYCAQVEKKKMLKKLSRK
ncbi:hypothetical protein WR25_12438 [Diploscapter pachys]|uniref:Histone H2A n=1 Tax=Diploscapter pachys TaxID=2018661 RepID=A0A2A2JL56_9BILA|nr:hypothetical protein WR25_12438 [Diploscapter pachys]